MNCENVVEAYNVSSKIPNDLKLFQIYRDWQHLIDFDYRIPLNQITHLTFHVHSGDFSQVVVKTESQTVWGKGYGPDPRA